MLYLGERGDERTERTLESMARFLEDRRGRVEIDLGREHADVPHVGREQGKLGGNVGALTIPAQNPATGVGVANVVQAGAAACRRYLGNCGCGEESFERVGNRTSREDAATIVDEEGRIWCARREQIAHLEVTAELLGELGRKRHQPGLEELRFP